ncbi:SidC [Legionella sp.]|uniref:SidC n=1 Tax=Legionella sp. TaxID=459 RepID=UPI003C875702
MRLPLKEPLSARYLYLSPENIVHIFMPIVSGTTIGLDNTCKAVYALQEFFDKGSNSNKKASLKMELLAYKEALESDISLLLGADSPLRQQKQERLNQINAYLKVVGFVEKHPELNCLNSSFPSYPRPLESMMQDRATSNLYSIVLHPQEQDGYLRTEGVNPIFRVAHTSVSRNIEHAESQLQQALIKAYIPLIFHDLKAKVIDLVVTQLKALNKPFDFGTLRTLLHDTVQTELGVAIDFTKTANGVLLTQRYINEVMFFDNETKPKKYIQALFGFCAPDLFTTTIVSPFKYLNQAERWSIATQFLLGLSNIYAVMNGKTSQDTNFGAILDKHPTLCANLAFILAQAQKTNASIEEACLFWINEHAQDLRLKTPFTADDINAIKHDVAHQYAQIKDSPHFDEFFVLDSTKNGAFVMHQGSICTPFTRFVSSPLLDVPQALILPLEKARGAAPSLGITIPHKTTLLQCEVEINTATMDKASLQALYERIDSYNDAKLKEKLFTERPDFKLQINAKHFVQHVAYGQQNEAESLLKKETELAQELLTARDIKFTDYSGRTFTCSAYEYAWWAKDSHMRFMLERYMNDDTKQELLKRVQHIEEPIGTLFKKQRRFTYTQNGKEYRSAHFDLTPLKQALRTYIEAYSKSPRATDADWEELNTLWINIGLLQRKIPAHIVHEYCHPKRSFQDVVQNPSLLEASNPANLERGLMFYNWFTKSYDAWFTSASPREDSDLNFSFAILRARVQEGVHAAGRVRPLSAWLFAIDLSAIEVIDEVRTKDLMRSHEYLVGPLILQAPRIHGSYSGVAQ